MTTPLISTILPTFEDWPFSDNVTPCAAGVGRGIRLREPDRIIQARAPARTSLHGADATDSAFRAARRPSRRRGESARATPPHGRRGRGVRPATRRRRSSAYPVRYLREHGAQVRRALSARGSPSTRSFVGRASRRVLLRSVRSATTSRGGACGGEAPDGDATSAPSPANAATTAAIPATWNAVLRPGAAGRPYRHRGDGADEGRAPCAGAPSAPPSRRPPRRTPGMPRGARRAGAARCPRAGRRGPASRAPAPARIPVPVCAASVIVEGGTRACEEKVSLGGLGRNTQFQFFTQIRRRPATSPVAPVDRRRRRRGA